MTHYEYKVVPAPTRGQKAKGVKGPEARFAHRLEQDLNTIAADGWEFLRAETLPSEERSGLTSTQTHYRSVLVFRRARVTDIAESVQTTVETQSDGFQPMPEMREDEQHDAETTAQPDTAPQQDESDTLRDRVAQLMEQGDTSEKAGSKA
jgi:hypothetical protein